MDTIDHRCSTYISEKQHLRELIFQHILRFSCLIVIFPLKLNETQIYHDGLSDSLELSLLLSIEYSPYTYYNLSSKCVQYSFLNSKLIYFK